MNASSLEVRQVVARITEAIDVEYQNEGAMQHHIEEVRKLIDDSSQAMQEVVVSAEQLRRMPGALSQEVSRFKL